MKTLMSKPGLLVVGLLFSATSFAATVTVIPSKSDIGPGETFFVDVFGSGFPDTVGATLKLFFNSDVVQVQTPTLTAGIVLAPSSPFTGGIALPTGNAAFPSGGILSVLAPTVGVLPTGNFGGNAAFRIFFRQLGIGVDNIVLSDDQADFSWTDATTFGAIPVSYTQANASACFPEGCPPTPIPATAWLLGTGLAGLLGRRLRRSGA